MHARRRAPSPFCDVAAALLACVDRPASIGKQFDLVSGELPIAEAIAALP